MFYVNIICRRNVSPKNSIFLTIPQFQNGKWSHTWGFPKQQYFNGQNEKVPGYVWEVLSWVWTKYQTGHNLFALEALAASSTFSEFSSSPSSFLLTYLIASTRVSENGAPRWDDTIHFYRWTGLKLCQFYLHFAQIWARRRCIADVPGTYWNRSPNGVSCNRQLRRR